MPDILCTEHAGHKLKTACSCCRMFRKRQKDTMGEIKRPPRYPCAWAPPPSPLPVDRVLNWTHDSLSLKGTPTTTENNATLCRCGFYFFLRLPFIFLILRVNTHYFQSGKKWSTLLGILFLFTNAARGSSCPFWALSKPEAPRSPWGSPSRRPSPPCSSPHCLL